MATQTAEQTVIDVKAEPSALAPVQPKGWIAPAWTQEREDLLRKQIAPPTASKSEVDYFVAWCKRTGLDPFLKQAYLVERRAQIGNDWVTKHEPMASHGGMAARADAEADFRGMSSGAVYAGDTFDVDEAAHAVTHKWSLSERAKNGNKLIGAWAHLQRDGRSVPITYLPLESRVQMKRDGTPTKFWATMPAGMLVKCAEAEQYRRAYPNLLGGAFIREELADDEPAPTPPPAPSRTAAVLDKVRAANAAPPKSATPPPVPEAPPANTTPSGMTTAAPPPLEAVLRVGPHAGKPISGLDSIELAAAIAHNERGLKAQPNHKDAPVAREDLALLKAEEAARLKAAEEFGA